MSIVRYLVFVSLSVITATVISFSLYERLGDPGESRESRQVSTLTGFRGTIEGVERGAILVRGNNYGSLPILPRANVETLLLRISTSEAMVVKQREVRNGKAVYAQEGLEALDLYPGQTVFISLSQDTHLRAAVIEIRDEDNLLAIL